MIRSIIATLAATPAVLRGMRLIICAARTGKSIEINVATRKAVAEIRSVRRRWVNAPRGEG